MRKIFIITIMFILLTTLATATVWDDNKANLFLQLKFEGDGDLNDSSGNDYDATSDTTLPDWVDDSEGTPNSAMNATGPNSESIEMEDAGLLAQMEASPDSTTCLKMNTDGDDDGTFWGLRNADSNEWMYLLRNANDVNYTFYGVASGSQVLGINFVENTNQYFWLCWVMNNSDDVFLYTMNESDTTFQLRGSDTAAMGYDDITSNIDHHIGQSYRDGNFADVNADEYLMWNTSINAGDLTTIFYGTGNNYNVSAAGGGGTTINMSSPNPVTNSSFNVGTVNFNVSVNNSNEMNCSMYLNDTFNQTTTGIAIGTNTFVDFNITFDNDGQYNYTIGCLDGTNDTNTTTPTFFMDFEDPVISTNFVNDSIFYLNNLIAQFNFTDNILLHTINISIDDKVIFNETHVHETSYQYNLSYNVTNLSAGEHVIQLFVSDGHTAKELGGAYDWTNGLFNSYMKYEFYDEGWIKTEAKDSSLFDSWTTTRLTDRYTQTFKPSVQKSSHTFVEESDQPIHIIDKPGHYNDYWIIVGNHWKDYVLKNEPNSKVSIKRINPYKVEVTVTGITNNQEELEFQSIGDLNIVQQNYTFGVTNTSTSLSASILELQNQTISFQVNNTLLNSSAATLFYNGTERSTTKTIVGDQDIYTTSFTTPALPTGVTTENRTVNWNYTFIGSVNSEVGEINDTQQIVQLNIDNCSTYEMYAVNFTLKDEDNSSLVPGLMDAYFKVWISDENSFRDFNLTWGTNETSYGICISPNSSSYTAYMQMEYNAVDSTKYAKKLYYFINNTLNNVTSQVDLYFTAGTTQVELQVTDANDDPIKSAVIKVLSYDLETDTSKTTEILVTDTDGKGYAQIVLNTEWYSFIIEIDGVIRLQTLPTKITSTTNKFRIGAEDQYTDQFTTVKDMSHLLTFTNSTQTFSLTYSDSSNDVKEVCMNVKQLSLGNELLINETCLSSAAGTINIVILGDTSNNNYVAYAFATINPSFFMDSLSISFDDGYTRWGLSGIFVVMLIFLTLVMVGLWSPEISIVMGIVALITASIFDILFFDWKWMVTIVILGGIIIYKIRTNK